MFRARFSTVIIASALALACDNTPVDLDTNQRPSYGATGSTSFSESFEYGALSPNGKLEASDVYLTWANGSVIFNGEWDRERTYLRTTGANYGNMNVTAEVTVTVPGGFGGAGIAFLGLGAGHNGDCAFYCEQVGEPAIYARLMPDDFFAGVQITDVTDGFVDETDARTDAGAVGSGTHRVRMIWTAATRAFSVAIHKDYVDGPFVPTAVVGPVYATAGALSDGNARVFFGGAGNVTFHNLKIVANPAK